MVPTSTSWVTFSANSRWLIVGVDRGRNGSVPLYDRTLQHSLSTGVTVPEHRATVRRL